jgi:hypothetical protein
MLDQLERVGQLGRDGHDANMPASSLPESIKQRNRWLHQFGSRVDAALGYGKKWPFEMNAQRHRAVG